MRSSLRIAAYVFLATFAALASGAAEDAETDHSERVTEFVRIVNASLRPEQLRIQAGDAFGWLNYSNRIARVSFDKSVAKALTCRSPGTFRVTGERLESGDIQSQQFASLCDLAPGTYPYRVELRTGAGSGGGLAATLEGTIVVEPRPAAK